MGAWVDAEYLGSCVTRCGGHLILGYQGGGVHLLDPLRWGVTALDLVKEHINFIYSKDIPRIAILLSFPQE